VNSLDDRIFHTIAISVTATFPRGFPQPKRKGSPMTYADKLRRQYAAEMREFERCSMHGLRDIYDALTLALESMCGVYNRPRFDVEAHEGKLLDAETNRLHGLRAALVLHADERLLADDDDFAAYRDIVTRYEADCGSEAKEWFQLICKLERRKASVPSGQLLLPATTGALAH
jgi:hypothetical protein